MVYCVLLLLKTLLCVHVCVVYMHHHHRSGRGSSGVGAAVMRDLLVSEMTLGK